MVGTLNQNQFAMLKEMIISYESGIGFNDVCAYRIFSQAYFDFCSSLTFGRKLQNENSQRRQSQNLKTYSCK